MPQKSLKVPEGNKAKIRLKLHRYGKTRLAIKSFDVRRLFSIKEAYQVFKVHYRTEEIYPKFKIRKDGRITLPARIVKRYRLKQGRFYTFTVFFKKRFIERLRKEIWFRDKHFGWIREKGYNISVHYEYMPDEEFEELKEDILDFCMESARMMAKKKYGNRMFYARVNGFLIHKKTDERLDKSEATYPQALRYLRADEKPFFRKRKGFMTWDKMSRTEKGTYFDELKEELREMLYEILDEKFRAKADNYKNVFITTVVAKGFSDVRIHVPRGWKKLYDRIAKAYLKKRKERK